MSRLGGELHDEVVYDWLSHLGAEVPSPQLVAAWLTLDTLPTERVPGPHTGSRPDTAAQSSPNSPVSTATIHTRSATYSGRPSPNAVPRHQTPRTPTKPTNEPPQ